MNKDIRLYTDDLDDETKTIVRRIAALTTNRFRSHLYESQDGILVYWHQGWYNKLTGKWAVDVYQAFSGENFQDDAQEISIKSERKLSGIGFFDALHYVASQDVAMKELYNKVRDEVLISKLSDFPHHEAIAEQEHIPYTELNLPIPAADGMILVPGRFSAKAIEIAKKASGNIESESRALVALEQAVATPTSALSEVGTEITIANNAQIAGINYMLNKKQASELLQKINKVEAQLQSITTWFEHARDLGFKHFGVLNFMFVPFVAMGSAFTLGTKVHPRTVPHILMPLKGIDAAYDRLLKAADDLPEGILRDGFKQYGTDLMLLYSIGMAKLIFDAQEKPQLMKIASDRIAKFAKIAGFTNEKIDALCLTAEKGGFTKDIYEMRAEVVYRYRHLSEERRKLVELNNQLTYSGPK